MSCDEAVYGSLAVVALMLVTVGTRGFFLLPDSEPRLPHWLRRSFRHAPSAALLAMVAPEVLLSHGQWPADWRDARLFAVAAAVAVHVWRRDSVTGCILAGTATFLVLRLGFGWI